MKKSLLTLVALLSLLTVPVASIVAGETHHFHLTTVSWVKANSDNIDVDDRYVTLIGHVMRPVGEDSYIFTDGTGSIRLDAEDFDLPIGPKIVIGGRIDQDYFGFGHLEINLRQWHYAKAR